MQIPVTQSSQSNIAVRNFTIDSASGPVMVERNTGRSLPQLPISGDL